ncbi:MAG: YjjG family noncanonical pyrimidine nucleotidase [Fulvivirga sp.]
MQQYRTIFFDLDHTLWDYDTNSVEALSDLFHKYELHQAKGITLDGFLETFTKVNNKLWNNYNKGHIERDDIRQKRFDKILKKFGITDMDKSLMMSEEYISICPTKTNVFPYTFETLEYLKNKYNLYILTNGFDDVQHIKMTASNLAPYFKGVVTSDSGHRKPSREIFEYALDKAQTSNTESIMIGDNLSTDITGAQNAEMDAVFFNPHKREHKATVNYEISCISQLVDIL